MAKVTFIVFFTLCIPPSQFLNSLKLVNHTLKDITSIFQKLQINSNVQHTDKFRLPSAITTCLELMNLSAEQLRWCVSAVENPQGKYEGTGNHIADLRTWLSDIQVNADTCLDGFQGSSKFKDHISVEIEKVNILVSDVLNQVVDNTMSDNFTTPGPFPSWVKQSDKKLPKSRAQTHVDVVVDTDGTGNFTKVMDAVQATPTFSSKRLFVIHIKRGTYTENFFIDQTKHNLMVIEDSKDTTFISGNLSYSKRLTTKTMDHGLKYKTGLNGTIIMY